ncbi:MAG: hypothetical protein ACLFQR_05725 [Desulfovibrionales bacterium]
MSGEAKTTTSHDEIRKWAEERGGKPAAVKGTGGGKDPGIIRIRFPEWGDDSALEDISWDEFFEKFEASNLALVYQEETSSKEKSNFNKFVNRESVQA